LEVLVLVEEWRIDELEQKIEELEQRIGELERRINWLEKENRVLFQIFK